MAKKKKANIKKFTAASMLLSTLGSIGVSVAQAPVAFADDVNISVNMTHEEFINQIGPAAQKVAAENDLYASVMIAQAILESGWGQSGLAQAPNYNLFGVKGSYNGQTVNMSTQEYSGESAYTTSAGFRKYDSYEQSLQDNADIVSGDYYSGAWKSNTNSYTDATQYLTGRYATASDYNIKLNAIIEANNLTRFDVPGETTKVDFEKVTVKPDFETRTEKEIQTINYTTKENDSLWGIARENKVSIDQLHKWNDSLKDLDSAKLPAGKQLKVGEKELTKEIAYQNITEVNDLIHTVIAGDSVWSIGNKNNLTVDQVHELNPELRSDNLIFVNEKIKVGEETKKYEKILTEDEKNQLIKEAKEKEDELNAKAEAEARAKTNGSTSENGVVSLSHDVKVSENASEQAKAVIDVATQQIGTPYVWGGRAPGGFDCSGLMQYVFRTALGMEIGSWTVPQESAGTIIPISEAQPGDLYFWGAQGATTHVALATGNGEFIHAPQPGDNVKVGSTQWFTPSFAVRVL